MLGRMGLSFTSPEGWLDFEAHESDLRGSRGVAIIGFLMLFMAICNFYNTVRGVIVAGAWYIASAFSSCLPGGSALMCTCSLYSRG